MLLFHAHLHLGKVKQHAQENLHGGGGMGEIVEGD